MGVTVFGLLFAIVAVDFGCELSGRPPVGRWVEAWSRRYPLFAAGVALVFGALVGHFFWTT